jgi:hypothetical protein
VFYSGFIPSLLILITWVLSAYWQLEFAAPDFAAAIQSGMFEYLHFPGYGLVDESGWSMAHDRLDLTRHWWIKSEDLGIMSYCTIPLWMFLLPCLVATGVAWRSKLVRLNHCQQCDYDLAGNESGICPECGTAIESKYGAPAKPES